MITGLISALIGYVGADVVFALLARFGLTGVKATVAMKAGKILLPQTNKIVRHLKAQRAQHAAESAETKEINEAITALSAAERSVRENWFP